MFEKNKKPDLFNKKKKNICFRLQFPFSVNSSNQDAHAFKNNNLTNVVISDIVTIIENSAFSNNKIQTLVLYNDINMMHIGDFVFNKNEITHVGLFFVSGHSRSILKSFCNVAIFGLDEFPIIVLACQRPLGKLLQLLLHTPLQ